MTIDDGINGQINQIIFKDLKTRLTKASQINKIPKQPIVINLGIL